MTASPIEGLYNFRDTAGLPLRGGGVTPPGVLLRSDALASLTPKGLEALAATTVGVIVDLRTQAERTVAPDRIPDSRPITVVELPILQGAMADMAMQLGNGSSSAKTPPAHFDVPTLGDLYTQMLAGSADAFVQIARLIVAEKGSSASAVLVHCTAGKDRTGLATALMLDAGGVERAAVIDDYAASQNNLAGAWADGMIHAVSSYGVEITPALRLLITGTPPQAIEQALAWVDDHHGDAAGYLRSAGFTADELSLLRARFAA
ncbi:tyrosine-protein phosphatase [Microbacterium sp. A94]|uniref:tyrosine-protein phosphatase n=1 Tax=Microbacterium sp. A94 TaxID=3450717 RepID=UPI003F4317AF